MNKQDLARFRRTLFVFVGACMVGGLATSLALYVLLPTSAVFVIAAVVGVTCLIVGVITARRARAIARQSVTDTTVSIPDDTVTS